MKSTHSVFSTVALSLLFWGTLAQAQVTGTVTDKTTGKPAAGDTVVLVDPQAGMSEVARATTDARGHYSLDKSGSNYLVRVMHMGAPYFIGAPQGNAPGDIAVYDVATNVTGVYCEADVIEIEADNGQLRVNERYFVHNTSMPPKTQWSKRSFRFVLPADAVVEEVAAQRPGGLPTTLKMDSDGPKGHYALDFPIQPDDGQKSTLFQISYDVPYSGGKFTFHPQVTLATQSVGVLLPKSMTFAAASGSVFVSVPEDPTVQTLVAKNVVPGKELAFTVSGTGSIPREDQNGQGSQAQGPSAGGNQPGGGLGAPIGTPDPLNKFKWWILGGVVLLMAAGAGILLRKPATGAPFDPGVGAAPVSVSPTIGRVALLNAIKEELFALESEKAAGTLAPDEYATVKAALDTVLARALKRNS